MIPNLLDHPNHPRRWNTRTKNDEGLRKVILQFIADFANRDLSSDADYLKTDWGGNVAVFVKRNN